MGQPVSIIRTTYDTLSTASMSNAISDDKAGSLKLEAQRVTLFSGTNEEWRKWKNKTACAFEGSGYDKVLTDRSFANKHPKMNKIVYSQLAAATIDGTAHHIVAQLDDDKDGHAAWNALSAWYDGDIAKAETAEELRVKLQELTLTQGMDAMAYINKFLIYLRDLNKIPGEEYSASHGVSLFLRNIKDDDYQQEISILKTSNEQNIMKCVQAIRKRERELLRIRAERRKLRQYPKRLRDEDLLCIQGNKLRRVGDGTISGDVHLTNKGFIHLSNDQYRSLDEPSKTFIRQYNKQVRAGLYSHHPCPSWSNFNPFDTSSGHYRTTYLV